MWQNDTVPDRPRSSLTLAAIALGIATANGAMAQRLEKVIVTAQKRVESLQDVPISVATVGGEKIADTQMHNLQDMSFSMPNVTINEAPFDNNLFIRGIGSGVNAGFERPVGMYCDGVHAGKGQLSRTPFLDVERVEVLKGPRIPGIEPEALTDEQKVLVGTYLTMAMLTRTYEIPLEDDETFRSFEQTREYT